MVFLRNICINTLHKGDNDDDNNKGKYHPRTVHEGLHREQMYSSTLYLTSMLEGMGGQRHTPAALPQERAVTHCVGGWVSLRPGLDMFGRIRPSPGFNPRSVQSVVRHCLP